MAPSPAYVWIGGSWGWGGGRYNWRPGRWAMPPRPGYGWHEGAGTMALVAGIMAVAIGGHAAEGVR